MNKLLNLKVRMKNPCFWLTIVPALITFVYTALGAFEVVPAVSESSLVNAFTTLITALTTLGVLIDPTTKGVADSERALKYEKPGKLPEEIEE